jgi:hypothetical protein
LCRHIVATSETGRARVIAVTIARILALLWFVVAFSLARAGWFEQFSSATLFGFGAVLSASGFVVLFWLSQTFRDYTLARSLKEATLLQVFRAFGTLALIKARQGVLPNLFALPTGIGDLVMVFTCFYVATRLVSDRGHPRKGFSAWHVIGLAHLGASAALAVLTSSPRFGLVIDGVTSQPMSQFPMNLAPTFIGPFVLIAHLSALVVARTALKSHGESFAKKGG